jgi:hypothetical protein
MCCRVAFKEIPERELRVILYLTVNKIHKLPCCIQRNPRKGIDGDVIASGYAKDLSRVAFKEIPERELRGKNSSSE